MGGNRFSHMDGPNNRDPPQCLKMLGFSRIRDETKISQRMVIVGKALPITMGGGQRPRASTSDCVRPPSGCPWQVKHRSVAGLVGQDWALHGAFVQIPAAYGDHRDRYVGDR